ncbi:MAG: hypothetical protein M1817_002886 [Caeruleum heppii]|nr:MAG: hypothetical protein M1817_002886 [Caeruleum heppii]
MAPTYRIAVIQLYPKPLQIEHNFLKASNFIRQAAAQGAQLAVLPEYHLTGWVPTDPKFSELAGQWQTYLERYQGLARECNICIVPGTIVERVASPKADREEDEVQLVNVAYFIDDKGSLSGRYEKKNLWHPERPHLTSGAHAPHEVIQTPLGPVGLLICWDLAFPEAFRELIANGAKIIIIPTFWTLSDCSPTGLARNPQAEALFLDSILTSRAFENTCAIIFANAAGPSHRGYCGLSQITVPFVGPLGRLPTSDEGMKIVDLDMLILEEAEDNYRVRADLAKSDWHYQGTRGGKPSTL